MQQMLQRQQQQQQPQPPPSYSPFTPSPYSHQRQPTRASQPSAPLIFLSGSSSRSGGGVGGDGGGGGGAFFAGSPRQHSAPNSYTVEFWDAVRLSLQHLGPVADGDHFAACGGIISQHSSSGVASLTLCSSCLVD
ncbi:unnamed protein product [Mesocestoides corti]|uniref:Uncharacterized protein n=1 Tax=Mesocestoides corti TaxID=53468 RepID=A0A0R3URN1_MESCO|nr:unnamed protein product [Mesocestoides corti]